MGIKIFSLAVAEQHCDRIISWLEPTNLDPDSDRLVEVITALFSGYPH